MVKTEAFVSFAVGFLFLSGCATAPRITLSPLTLAGHSEMVWWVTEDPASLRPSIIAIEYHRDDGGTRQVLFCRQGVRFFEYRYRRLELTTSPLPGPDGPADMAMVRVVLRCLRNESQDTSSQGLRNIPPDEIETVTTMQRLSDLLRFHWPQAQVDTPAGLTFRDIDAELSHFPHGALELDKASEPF